MNRNKMMLLAGAMSMAAAVGCSHMYQAKEEMKHEVNHAAAAATVAAVAPGSEYAVVQFEKGSHALSQSGREELNRVAQMGSSTGHKIDQIKILAWADREYPADGSKATKRDVNLADSRADVIKTYIKDDLHTNASIDKHNMAKRPGFFSELVKTDDYKMKKNIQGDSSTPSYESEKLFNGSKESKAIVLITYE